MKINSKGQVTIPQEFREMFGLIPHTQAEFISENGRLIIQPAVQPKDRGKAVVGHLRRFARYRNELTTDEIMAMTRGED